MKINNLDVGLRKTLIAAFRSKGQSEAAAKAKAAKYLGAAQKHFLGKLVVRETLTKKLGRSAAGAAVTPVSKPTPVVAAKNGSKASAKSAPIAAPRPVSPYLASLRRKLDLHAQRPGLSSDSPQDVAAALRSVAVWARSQK